LSKVTVLYTVEEISRRINELAEEINKINPEKDLVIIALLNGSFVFASDLIRSLSRFNLNPKIDFMTISSYGSGTKSSGKIKLHKDITIDVKDKMVLLLDDILESGRSLEFARSALVDKGANSVKIAALLEKSGKRVKDIKADFVGFKVPDLFVVGYGLDYDGLYRELPYIAIIDKPDED